MKAKKQETLSKFLDFIGIPASSIEILTEEPDMDIRTALEEAGKYLNIRAPTLLRWYNEFKKDPHLFIKANHKAVS